MGEDEKIELVEEITEEKFDTLLDFETKYIRSPKVGEAVEFVIKGLKIVKDRNDLEFTFDKNGKQKTVSNALSNVDYGVKLITDSDSEFWVNSWSVFGQIKAIAKKLSNMSLHGVKLKISHAADGMLEENREIAWVVYVDINGEFKQLNRNSNDWI